MGIEEFPRCNPSNLLRYMNGLLISIWTVAIGGDVTEVPFYIGKAEDPVLI